jgi:hypothetical protein
MLEPPSLTILPLRIAPVAVIDVAGLVSTVGVLSALTGSASPPKSRTRTAMMLTMAKILTFIIDLLRNRELPCGLSSPPCPYAKPARL